MDVNIVGVGLPSGYLVTIYTITCYYECGEELLCHMQARM